MEEINELEEKTETNEIVVKADENKLTDLEKKIDYLSKNIKESLTSNVRTMPIPVDMRYATTIMMLNDEYYGLFANMKNMIEVVPYCIIEKAIKASAKSYKRDLKQVKAEYSKILKADKVSKSKLTN